MNGKKTCKKCKQTKSIKGHFRVRHYHDTEKKYVEGTCYECVRKNKHVRKEQPKLDTGPKPGPLKAFFCSLKPTGRIITVKGIDENWNETEDAIIAPWWVHQ